MFKVMDKKLYFKIF